MQSLLGNGVAWPKLPVSKPVPVAFRLETLSSMSVVVARVMLSPGTILATVLLALPLKMIVRTVPALFQDVAPKLLPESSREWPLFTRKLFSRLAELTTGLFVLWEKASSMLSPGSLADVPPVFFATALTRVGAVATGAMAKILAVVVRVVAGLLAEVVIAFTGRVAVNASAGEIPLQPRPVSTAKK